MTGDLDQRGGTFFGDHALLKSYLCVCKIDFFNETLVRNQWAERVDERWIITDVLQNRDAGLRVQ